jgi:hypothetical protein
MQDDSNEAVLRADNFAASHMVRNAPIDTTTEIKIDVFVADEKVRVAFTRAGLPTWFANVFGISSMGITAHAVAHVHETSKASCVMPVAIPDIWWNKNVEPSGPSGSPEEIIPDGLWNFKDQNANGVMDSRERELWEFDSDDVYDQTLYGYGSSFRNGLSTDPFLNKINDYGRQVTLMTLAPQDGTTSSNYYTWGYTTNEANSATQVANRITTPDCQIATIGGDGYPVQPQAGNGAQVGPISNAWNTRIGYDNEGSGASWNDVTNSVDGSKYGANWFTDSPRVVIVALYNPAENMSGPSDNTLQFNNFAKVWLDQRPCTSDVCKAPITGRFLGFVGGPGGGEAVTGTLIKHIQLIE